MKKKEFLYLFMCVLFSGIAFTSCSDDDDPGTDPEIVVTRGAYILNTGGWGSNSSTLDYYNLETQKITGNILRTSEGGKLGDTANDMLVYGSKMYIAVNGSNTIEVTDLSGKPIQTIIPENSGSGLAGPRNLAAYEDKVYVTLFDGYLARIDTASLVVESKVEVGVGVEQVCVSGDKLYTAISSYYPHESRLVKEVDIKTFTVTKELDVIDNPCAIQADESGNLYVVSFGVAPDYNNKLIRVDPKTGEKKDLLENSQITITRYKDYLYIISMKTKNFVPAGNPEFLRYNTVSQAFEKDGFVRSDVTIKNAKCVDVDPVTGDAYILSGYDTANGDLVVVSKEGKLVKQVELSSSYPACTRFVTIEE